MRKDDLNSFAKELNELTRKHGVRIVRMYGPMLMLKDDPHGTDYSGALFNQSDEWVISEPWGG